MKDNQRIFIFLFAFFAVVALGSLVFLGTTGSVFDRTRESAGATTAVMSQTIVPDEASSEESVEEVVEEPVVEEPKEEPVVEEPVVEEPVVEEPVEEPVVEEESPLKYYTFKTNTKSTILRLREQPSQDSAILKKLKMQTPGYVLKPGNVWCKVVTETGETGYCATQYLVLTEVTKEEFPQEYVDMVEAPDEELGEAFGN